MKKHFEKRFVDHSPEQMFDLVSNIKSYPDFLPWCTDTKIINSGEGMQTASVTISIGKIKKRFTTLNKMQRGISISMNLIEGPTMVRGGVLKRLWQRFKNLFNNPSTNPAGKPWMNKIDPSDHAGDAPPPDPTNYDQFGDFGYTGGTSGTTNSFTGRGSTSF